MNSDIFKHSHIIWAFCLVSGLDTSRFCFHCLQPINTPLTNSCSSCDGLKVLIPPPVIPCAVLLPFWCILPCLSSFCFPFCLSCKTFFLCACNENAYTAAWHAACITKPWCTASYPLYLIYPGVNVKMSICCLHSWHLGNQINCI